MNALVPYKRPSQYLKKRPASKALMTMPAKRYRLDPYSLNKITKVKRSFNVVAATDGVNPTLFSRSIALNSIPNAGNLINVFDAYKFTGVKIRFLSYQTQSTSTSAVNNCNHVPIFYAVDTNDSTAPANIAEVQSYNSHKCASIYEGFTVYWTPEYSGNSDLDHRKDFISTANSTEPWLGLKVGIPATGFALNYNLVITGYLSFKQMK